MGNSMKQYGCSLKQFSDTNNNICMKPRESFTTVSNRFKGLEDTATDWSDLVAFVNIGGKAEKNGEKVSLDTGGWVGPYLGMMFIGILVIIDMNMEEKDELKNFNRKKGLLSLNWSSKVLRWRICCMIHFLFMVKDPLGSIIIF